jgi:nucleoid-associated protein YgaU
MPSGLSADSGELIKAFIFNEDTQSTVVECLFNPTDYTFSKSNTWTPDKAPGKDIPIVNFQGGGPTTLQVSLMFDTYAAGKRQDVRDYTEKVVSLMNIAPNTTDSQSKTGRPPRVSFRWGNSWSFKAVITQISQHFTLFLSDGTPVRATLDVHFTQVEQQGTYHPTNPTSIAETQKVHLVGPGETIDGIAFRELGDASKWRLIADLNNLDNPMRLRPGDRLASPLAR